MSLIKIFVENPVKVSVGMLLLVMFGVIGLLRMPMQLTPEVETPTLTIQTRWSGASPQEIEREIIQPQEEQLQSVEGVRKMTSESKDSAGSISLEFGVGTDMSEALLKVNTRLQQVREYPESADEPIITTANSSNRPIAWIILSPRVPTIEELALASQGKPELSEALAPALKAFSLGLRLRRLQEAAKKSPAVAALLPPILDMTQFKKFAEDVIESRLERVDGVANANVIGGREQELQVIIDPVRLASRSITISELREALRRENLDTSAGDLWEGKRRYVVRTLGQFRSPGDVANVRLASQRGAPIYVKDVARVALGYKKPTGVVRHIGISSLAINCERDSGANVISTMDGIKRAVAELNAGVLLPRQLQLEQVYDETTYIYSSVGLVKQNIVVGGLLTICVLLLFLRSGRSTLIIGLAIPISIVGTFLVLDLLGRSLNVISLAGLSFAVGMIVDNAVVVLENIYRHSQEGESPSQAAIKGAQEVGGAVLASTLTTLAVFLPVLFMQDQAGQLFGDIAVAISAAVGLSLLVSMTVIPTAAARMELSSEGEGWAGKILSPVDRLGGGFVALIIGINRWLQGGYIRRLVAISAIVGGSFGLSVLTFPKVEYLPSGNRNLVFGILLPPAGYNLKQLLEIGVQIENDLKPYWDVDEGSAEAAKLDYPIIGDMFYVARGRQVFLGLRAKNPLHSALMVPLIRRAAGKIPGTFGIAKQASLFEQGLSAGRTIDIEIAGPRLEELVGIALRVFGKVRQVMPTAQAFPKPSLDLTSPELHVVPKLDVAGELGVSASELGYALNVFIDGAYATDYFIGGDKIDLSLVGRSAATERLQDLEDLPMVTPSGKLVPLSVLADVRLSAGPEQINHRERQRTITIQVSPPPNMALERALETIQKDVLAPFMVQGALSPGVQINLSGTADKLRETWESLRWNVVLALLITYLLMAALFESWLYPLVIILSVPVGAFGGFLGLWLLNRFTAQPLDVLTMLGFVILIGTVVNNAILIVHQALNLMAAEAMESGVAVLESVRTRIRPIFMTTSTTLFGLLPLVLVPGAGSELYRGLGSVVLGGLAVSSVITLVLVPALFTLTLDVQRKWIGRAH